MVYCTTVIMNMARVSGYGTQKASVTQVQSRISFKVFIPQTNKVPNPIKLRRSKNKLSPKIPKSKKHKNSVPESKKGKAH